MRKKPILYIVVPCYNEQEALPLMAPVFLKKMKQMIGEEKIHEQSRILFVNDGSRDDTWNIICQLSKENRYYLGLSLSRNHGHQNALLAGLMEAKDRADITISIDCDGQDDVNAMEQMVDEYLAGAEIVYGVRSRRDTDTFFKRFTAESFYRLMKWMGAEVVFNHADYRLVSSRALEAFSDFHEVNIFLRGMFPLVGFRSTAVYYERTERVAGKTHYPLKKMLALALDGITSLSIRPIRLITVLGVLVFLVGCAITLWAIALRIAGKTVAGWTSMICVVAFLGGLQLLATGIVGEYIGKIYMETKARPRYIISERTYKESENNNEGKKERE